MLSVAFIYYYAECFCTECRYAECCYAECRGPLRKICNLQKIDILHSKQVFVQANESKLQ
jgi:hypothetical protein